MICTQHHCPVTECFRLHWPTAYRIVEEAPPDRWAGVVAPRSRHEREKVASNGHAKPRGRQRDAKGRFC